MDAEIVRVNKVLFSGLSDSTVYLKIFDTYFDIILFMDIILFRLVD